MVCLVTGLTLQASRTALQNRGWGTAVKQESGGWMEPVGEKTHNCTAEIRNKHMEEQLLWKISCPVGTLIASAL